MSKRKTGKRSFGNPVNRRPLYGDLARSVQPSGNADPTKLGGDIAGPGGPHDRNAVVIDMTDAVLLDYTHVATVETFKDGDSNGQAIFLTMGGRVNKKTHRAQVGFVFDSDGAAALISELLALADRFGTELLTDLVDRLMQLQKDNNLSLAFLRAAIELAEEEAAK